VLGGKKIYADEMDAYQPTHDVKLWEEFKLLARREKFEEAEAVAAKMIGQDLAKSEQVLRMGREWNTNHKKVVEAGGLHIVGTERHEARRIDNQLRGRSGRQGDPGSSRFYLSLEDNLMRIFGGERIYNMMDSLGMQEDEPIESGVVTKAIASAQKRVEGRNFEIRKHLLEYDDVMNSQREFIYKKRDEILEGEDISGKIDEYFQDVIADAAEQYSDGKKSVSDWDLDALKAHLAGKFGFNLDEEAPGFKSMSTDSFIDEISAAMFKKYKSKESHIGTPNLRHLERMIALQVIDTKWREHLLAMDELRDGIWTVGYGARDPLVEYKLRGFGIFQEIIIRIKLDIVEFLMKVQFRETEEPAVRPAFTAPRVQEVHQEFDQFGAKENFGAPQQSAQIISNKPKEASGPIEGGSKRKKTRRSRKG